MSDCFWTNLVGCTQTCGLEPGEGGGDPGGGDPGGGDGDYLESGVPRPIPNEETILYFIPPATGSYLITMEIEEGGDVGVNVLDEENEFLVFLFAASNSTNSTILVLTEGATYTFEIYPDPSFSDGVLTVAPA